LRSGDLSIFFLKSNCWKRSILWFPRTIQRSLIRYLKASSYFLVMGNYFFLTEVNFCSSNFMNDWRALIYSSLFSMKVMMKGLE
jgi:hypothetical protein